jgi:hypothetical protein
LIWLNSRYREQIAKANSLFFDGVTAPYRFPTLQFGSALGSGHLIFINTTTPKVGEITPHKQRGAK